MLRANIYCALLMFQAPFRSFAYIIIAQTYEAGTLGVRALRLREVT